MLPFLWLLFLHVFSVSAQFSSSPGQGLPQWSYEQRVNFAGSALDVGVKGALIGPNGTLSGADSSSTPIFYAQLAEFDIITQKTTYKEVYQTLFTQAAKGFSTVFVFDYILYGYAALRAWTAYNDQTFLTLAEGFWDQAMTYTITSDNVASKKISTKTAALRDSCNGKSYVGAVFENPGNATDGSIDPRTVGAFLTLSALLAESTKEDKYTQAALQTLQFLRDFMYFPRSNAGNEAWTYALVNRACDDKTPQPVWYPVSGNIIEGLSILISVTGDGDGALRTLLQETIDFATLFRESQRQDGIIVLSVPISNLPTGDPHLIRALSVACRRNATLFTDSIKGFVNIQYNALLTNTTIQGSNMYGGSWIGPPERGLNAINQTYASMVLVHGITLGGSNTTTTTTTTQPSGPSNTAPPGTPQAKSTPAGAIAGGVIGGLAFFGVLIGVFFFLRRRKQKLRRDGPSEYIVSPFVPPATESETVETQSNFAASIPSPYPITITARPTTTKMNTKSPSLGVSRTTQPSVSSPSSSSAIDSGGSYSDDPHARFQAMSTAEMARILNARLQTESFNGEMPPAYPQSQIGLQ